MVGPGQSNSYSACLTSPKGVRFLTLARDLRRRRARERQHLFVAEGSRAVEELLRSPLRVRGALVTATPDLSRHAALLDRLRERGAIAEEVSEADFATAAETETPQGILAIAEVPRRDWQRLADGLPASAYRILVLDAVQDPGNAGALIRTAAALGAAATVALPGTVDLWNAKVVRSAMGAHFHHPAFASTWAELVAFLDEREAVLWAADSGGELLDVVLQRRADLPPRLALAVGNEGGGLSSLIRERAEKLVALPIAPAVESLNVAVATGILLYELRP